MSSKNLTYILGAGSSKDFGFPLGPEIFARAVEVMKTVDSADIKTGLRTAIEEVDQIMAKIYSDLPSDKAIYPLFEEVLTFIWQSRKYEYQDWENGGELVSLYGKDTRDVFKVFVDMLTLTLSAITLSDPFNEELCLYQEFIKSLVSDKHKISIISLNYDLIVDSVLLTCVKEGLIEDFNYGVPLYSLADGHICRKGGISLLKPHGSLNLSFCTGQRWGTSYHYSPKDNTIDIMKEVPTMCADGSGHYVRPLIIPPLYVKESYAKESKKAQVYQSKRGVRTLDEGVIENYRKRVDRRIDDALQNADEITIIGYSMPPYDFDFKSLLIKGLMNNKNRAAVQINIIDKGKGDQLDELKSRFKHLAGEVKLIGQNGFLDYIRSQVP
jgi:hypothetical protein